uniref:FGFR1 oncogene partner (FOP) N-terminal dimerisation domain-containing protein n=1 Tax=Homalodisca liturata TaxID=320908 RepID=A0A1B6I7I8_9HEMI
MSVNGNTELRDLVSQTLENTGVLSKIRAELRANVFLVLEEHEAFKGRNLPFCNSVLKNFLSTQEGIAAISLVREFLEFFGLEFTVSVFEPETQAGSDYTYVGRNKLAHNLKLDSGKKSPLIAQILQQTKLHVPATTVPIANKIQEPVNNSLRKEKPKEEKKSQETNNINHIVKTDVTNGPSESLDQKHPQPPPPSFQNHNKKPDSLKLDLSQMNVKSAGGSMSSLGSLPPLGMNPTTKSNSGRNSKHVSSDIKALLDLGSDSPEHYEEDFHLSGSEKTSKGTNRSLSGSGSEIEEEMSVGIDDQDQDHDQPVTDQSGSGSSSYSGNENTPRDL